jgi:hypothetical protein
LEISAIEVEALENAHVYGELLCLPGDFWTHPGHRGWHTTFQTVTELERRGLLEKLPNPGRPDCELSRRITKEGIRLLRAWKQKVRREP